MPTIHFTARRPDGLFLTVTLESGQLVGCASSVPGTCLATFRQPVTPDALRRLAPLLENAGVRHATEPGWRGSFVPAGTPPPPAGACAGFRVEWPAGTCCEATPPMANSTPCASLADWFVTEARPAAPGPACATDADCSRHDGCGCTPCRAVSRPEVCTRTCGRSTCTGEAARCNPTTHTCELVWAGVIHPGNGPVDLARAVPACSPEGTPMRLVPSRAGVYDPSTPVDPMLLNWAAHGCFTYPGASAEFRACGDARSEWPIVYPTLCMQ